MQSVRGLNGEVSFDGEAVTVRRRRLFGRRTRSLPVTTVLSVEFRPGGATANGYLHFLTLGSARHDGDLQAAIAEPDTVMLAAFQNRAFRRLAVEIAAAVDAAAARKVVPLRNRRA